MGRNQCISDLDDIESKAVDAKLSLIADEVVAHTTNLIQRKDKHIATSTMFDEAMDQLKGETPSPDLGLAAKDGVQEYEVRQQLALQGCREAYHLSQPELAAAATAHGILHEWIIKGIPISTTDVHA